TQIIQKVQIIRHAERAPMYEFTSSESAKLFPRGLGEITDEGIRHAKHQGAAFRRHYEELGLLSEKTKSNEIYIRISPLRRVRMSATAFASSIIGTQKVQLPRIYNENAEKVLVVHDSTSYRCEVLARHNISDGPLCRSVSVTFDSLTRLFCTKNHYNQFILSKSADSAYEGKG
ncbi:hypothetical protein PMAYCL1PPCAC_14026, partial [Pristionchus mayeri]